MAASPIRPPARSRPIYATSTYAQESPGTLIAHPAIMTHASVPVEQRRAFGIGDSLVCLSIGIEDAHGVKADLEHSLTVIS